MRSIPMVWLFLFLGSGCDRHTPLPTNAPPSPQISSAGQERPIGVKLSRYTYEIVNVFPHDKRAFTEGLVFRDGNLFESTGLKGESSLREIDIATGRILRQLSVPNYFAEGLSLLKGKAYQLTWQTQTGFIYDQATFRLEGQFTYSGEGWGLATDGQRLIMSDGTSEIRFLNSTNFEVERTIKVSLQNQPVTQLNELEYIKGEIFANIWQTDYVVIIDPADGEVTGIIDFRDLLPLADHDPNTDVLNGIAYDAINDRLFVTGKCWPKLFEVRLKRL